MNDPSSHPEFLQKLAEFLGKDVIPEAYGQRMGFALLIFPFDDGIDGRIDYVSNAARPEMLIAMKEFIANNEGRVHTTETKQ